MIEQSPMWVLLAIGFAVWISTGRQAKKARATRSRANSRRSH